MRMATGHMAYLDAVSSAIAVIQTLEFSKKPQDLYLIGAPEIVMSSWEQLDRAERIYKEHTLKFFLGCNEL